MLTLTGQCLGLSLQKNVLYFLASFHIYDLHHSLGLDRFRKCETGFSSPDHVEVWFMWLRTCLFHNSHHLRPHLCSIGILLNKTEVWSRAAVSVDS